MKIKILLLKNNIGKQNNAKKIAIILFFLIAIILYYMNTNDRYLSMNGSFIDSSLYNFNGNAYIKAEKIRFLRGKLINRKRITVKINNEKYEVEPFALEIVCDSVPYNDNKYASTPHEIEVENSSLIVTKQLYDGENQFNANKIEIKKNNDINHIFLGIDKNISVKLNDVNSSIKLPNNRKIRIKGVNTDVVVNNKNINNRLDGMYIYITDDGSYSDFDIQIIDDVEFDLYDFDMKLIGTISEFNGKLNSTSSEVIFSSRKGQKEYKIGNETIKAKGVFNIDMNCNNTETSFTLHGRFKEAKIGNLVMNSDIIQFFIDNFTEIIIVFFSSLITAIITL